MSFKPEFSLRREAQELEDSFFAEQDRKLIEKREQLKKLNETKENLAQVSGIKNDVILEKLVQLDIRPETLAALAVIPLIEVAWADRTVDDKERAVLLENLENQGIPKDSIEFQLVHQWLSHKPSPSLLHAWTHYIEGLCEALAPGEIAALRDELMKNTTALARASGGFLGLGNKISKSEAEMIQKLTGAFRL